LKDNMVKMVMAVMVMGGRDGAETAQDQGEGEVAGEPEGEGDGEGEAEGQKKPSKGAGFWLVKEASRERATMEPSWPALLSLRRASGARTEPMSRRNCTLMLVALQKFHSSWLESRPSRLMPKPRRSSSSASADALADEVALAAAVGLAAMPVVLAERSVVVDPRMLTTTKRRVMLSEDEALILRKRRVARSVALRLITDSSLALADSVSDSAPPSDRLASIPVSGRPHRSRLVLSSWDLTASKSIELVTLAPAWSEF